MNPPIGSAASGQDAQRDGGAEEPDERALEHERPADERVRRPDEAHDLDLLGARDHGEPDRVDDDEQGDDPDDDQQDGAGCPEDVRDREDALDEILDVDDVADLRLIAKGRR